jgi:hypothetical protein
MPFRKHYAAGREFFVVKNPCTEQDAVVVLTADPAAADAVNRGWQVRTRGAARRERPFLWRARYRRDRAI